MATQDSPPSGQPITYRRASAADVAAISECRRADPAAGPADERMTAYFNGQHHPQRALMPRTGYIAIAGGSWVGYIAGHLTTRHACAGEVQYLYVAPEYRRNGIATALITMLAAWFTENAAARVCVCLDTESATAEPFYRSVGAVPLSPEKKYWFVWQDISILARSPR